MSSGVQRPLPSGALLVFDLYVQYSGLGETKMPPRMFLISKGLGGLGA